MSFCWLSFCWVSFWLSVILIKCHSDECLCTKCHFTSCLFSKGHKKGFKQQLLTFDLSIVIGMNVVAPNTQLDLHFWAIVFVQLFQVEIQNSEFYTEALFTLPSVVSKMLPKFWTLSNFGNFIPILQMRWWKIKKSISQLPTSNSDSGYIYLGPLGSRNTNRIRPVCCHLAKEPGQI